MSARKKRMVHDLYARIPEDLWQQVKALAEQHKRSVTAEVEWALQQYVQEQTGQVGTGEPRKARNRGRKP